MNNNEAFLGRGWGFPPEFFSGGAQVQMVAAEEDIQQSLRILLSTSMGERTLFSSYGCSLNSYQFEEVDQSLVNNLRDAVTQAILENEPRVQTDSVEIDRNRDETGLLLIAVYYTVRATNNRYNLVYPFYINEASVPVA